MSIPGTEVWRKAAEALAASDAAALAAILPGLPPVAAKALAEAVRKPGRNLPTPPELPDGVDCVADSRFAAIFARERVVVRWKLPGRELATGCYLTAGDTAEFILNPGDWRFIILRESGEDA